MINIKQRNIFVCLILSILTCGIYSIFWLYTIIKTMYELSNTDGEPILDILFIIITCGLYGFYLWYKLSKIQTQVNHTYNIADIDNTVLYIVFYIFGFAIVNYCIVQDNINNIAQVINNNQGFNNNYYKNSMNDSYTNTQVNDTNENNDIYVFDKENESIDDNFYDSEYIHDIDEDEQKFDDLYDDDNK